MGVRRKRDVLADGEVRKENGALWCIREGSEMRWGGEVGGLKVGPRKVCSGVSG